ncbi:MAG: hypothetical protein AB7F59_03285 [Bdellovibrionales bacterium]
MKTPIAEKIKKLFTPAFNYPWFSTRIFPGSVVKVKKTKPAPRKKTRENAPRVGEEQAP